MFFFSHKIAKEQYMRQKSLLCHLEDVTQVVWAQVACVAFTIHKYQIQVNLMTTI